MTTPRQRTDGDSKEALESGQQVVSDEVVYAVEHSSRERRPSSLNLDRYVKAEIWFCVFIEIMVGPDAEQFIAIIEDWRVPWSRRHDVENYGVLKPADVAQVGVTECRETKP